LFAVVVVSNDCGDMSPSRGGKEEDVVLFPTSIELFRKIAQAATDFAFRVEAFHYKFLRGG